mgnify:CR=1 FL=1
MRKRVVIVGGGIVGAALAHDLALRGLQVILLEKESIGYGTSGRTHGLLHSGCRYVRESEVAKMCYEENLTLRRIAPELFETNGGYFVGLTEEDLEYEDEFVEGCERAEIPIREVKPQEALKREPSLNPSLKKAFEVPDGTFDPLKVILSFLATAKKNGAVIRAFNEVVGFKLERGEVKAVEVRDKIANREYLIEADYFVNATGPWAREVASMYDGSVELTPTVGAMISFRKRFVNRVINRLNPPSDGDILLPQRSLSVLGTTSRPVDSPDFASVTREEIDLLIRRGKDMVPSVSREEISAVFISARPLLGRAEGSGREISREFSVVAVAYTHLTLPTN